MSALGIQGQLLEVTVVGCSKLKNTEWISRQDPYVRLEYASTKYRTRTCTDGGKNATFQEKFVFTLIEGLPEISVAVWNSNTISLDAFIGSGRVQLLKVLTQGYDDSAWALQDKKGRYAGEVRLIMHFAKAVKPTTAAYPSAALAAMPHGVPSAPELPPSQAHPPTAYPNSYPPAAYPPSHPPAGYPPSYPPAAYPPSHPPPAYPPSSYSPSQAYPPYPVSISGYSQRSSYDQPAHYPSAYPQTSTYPPPSVYPPPPQDPRYHTSGSFPPPTYPP